MFSVLNDSHASLINAITLKTNRTLAMHWAKLRSVIDSDFVVFFEFYKFKAPLNIRAKIQRVD